MANVSFQYSTNDDLYPAFTDQGSSLQSTLTAWATSGVPGTHPTNTGGFYEEGEAVRFNGDTYAFTTASGYAFSATGSLHYYFPPLSGEEVDGATSHTLWGTLESISFGGGLDEDGTVSDPFLTINFDDPITSSVLDGYGGDVHSIIYGLMNASVSELLTTLASDYNITTTQNIDLLPNSTPYSSTLVGVSEVEDVLLAA